MVVFFTVLFNHCPHVSPHNLLPEYPQYFLPWQEVFLIDRYLFISVFISLPCLLPDKISHFDEQAADHRYLVGPQAGPD